MMRRETITSQPAERDYVLSPTGFSWSVRRSNGRAAAYSVSEGHPDRQAGLTTLLSLSQADRTDAWETLAPGVFRLVQRFRDGADQPAVSRRIPVA